MSRSITKEQIAAFDTEEFKGQIFVIDTPAATEKAVSYLCGFDLLGFDTETRPSFRKGKRNGVALIQLATHSRCYLFRLHMIGFFPSLIDLLADTDIQKIGISLRDDFATMSRFMKFTPQGFLDLQKIVSNHNITDMSLQKIYAILFQKKISKNQRLSNWEAKELSEAQIKYAALDAWACLKIYENLCLTNESF